MYRGYGDYRKFLHAKLHALSAVICGDDTLLDENLSLAGVKSVKELELEDARKLYIRFSELARQVSKSTNELKSAIGEGKMNDRQRKMIIAITKYQFKWSPEASFSFILELFPDYRKRMSVWEVQNSKLYKLYSMLTEKDADRVIKRLLQIEKRNEFKSEEQ